MVVHAVHPAQGRQSGRRPRGQPGLRGDTVCQEQIQVAGDYAELSPETAGARDRDPRTVRPAATPRPAASCLRAPPLPHPRAAIGCARTGEPRVTPVSNESGVSGRGFCGSPGRPGPPAPGSRPPESFHRCPRSPDPTREGQGPRRALAGSLCVSTPRMCAHGRGGCQRTACRSGSRASNSGHRAWLQAPFPLTHLSAPFFFSFPF